MLWQISKNFTPMVVIITPLLLSETQATICGLTDNGQKISNARYMLERLILLARQ